ncbi:MAG: hypothetical protein IJG33_07910 [Selenomonadaceae bacterium]|nr:hypothetical protein [Selenomonadaceae bacterium]
MIPVSKRGGFSDRNGIKPLNTEIQLTDFDEHTRTALFNLIVHLYESIYGKHEYWRKDNQHFFSCILEGAYSTKRQVSSAYGEKEFFKIVHETILEDSYDSVLTVVEAIAQHFDEYLIANPKYKYVRKSPRIVYRFFNNLFKREYVGYHFIEEGFVSPISDEIEVKSVNVAVNNKFKSVREHISKANALLSDRKRPDYENSIKESISAVEAICQEILGTKGGGATLGKMLKKLEDNGIEIHSALKEAFNKLYGYTSDANGIRHAGDIGGSSSTFEEAKFMLVSCSAFINYLMGLKSKIKC